MVCFQHGCFQIGGLPLDLFGPERDPCEGADLVSRSRFQRLQPLCRDREVRRAAGLRAEEREDSDQPAVLVEQATAGGAVGESGGGADDQRAIVLEQLRDFARLESEAATGIEADGIHGITDLQVA